MKWLIEAEALGKKYGSFKAVDDVSFKVAKGEIFGILGPNGAGKSTTILMMLGLTEPTSGTISVNGYDPAGNPLKVKRITGYLPENIGFYEDLTAEENLLYFCRLNGIAKEEAERSVKEYIEMVDLKDSLHQIVGTFSKGMKQRLGIASILVKKPDLVILDEPTNGIDPEGTEYILNLITRMSREMGVTVVVSSHLLHQMQRICDRVAILFKGKVLAIGSIEEIGRKLFGQRDGLVKLKVSGDKGHVSLEEIGNLPGVIQASMTGETILLAYREGYMESLLKELMARDIYPVEVKSKEYSLEEIYLKYFREG
jgi:ABC-2 type transport system ATP-binding protein